MMGQHPTGQGSPRLADPVSASFLEAAPLELTGAGGAVAHAATQPTGSSHGLPRFPGHPAARGRSFLCQNPLYLPKCVFVLSSRSRESGWWDSVGPRRGICGPCVLRRETVTRSVLRTGGSIKLFTEWN